MSFKEYSKLAVFTTGWIASTVCILSQISPRWSYDTDNVCFHGLFVMYVECLNNVSMVSEPWLMSVRAFGILACVFGVLATTLDVVANCKENVKNLWKDFKISGMSLYFAAAAFQLVACIVFTVYRGAAFTAVEGICGDFAADGVGFILAWISFVLFLFPSTIACVTVFGPYKEDNKVHSTEMSSTSN